MPPTLVDLLSEYESVVEVGVGERFDVAERLAAAGVAVTVTDVEPRAVPAGLRFVRDDVTDPTLGVYEDADVIFAQRLPPELQRPVLDVAEAVGAACIFTTLGGDPAVVPATPRTVESGTLYEATTRQ